MIAIERLRDTDRAEWNRLSRAYKHFYETEVSDADLDLAWQRLQWGGCVQAWGARTDGRLVGIAHYLFHASLWTDVVCYLQDLFVDESARGRGVAQALIEQVAEAARVQGASRFYWLTQANNERARRVYDRLAEHRGFIRYDHVPR